MFRRATGIFSRSRRFLVVAAGLFITNVALAAPSWSDFLVMQELGTEVTFGEFAIWGTGIPAVDKNDPARCVPNTSLVGQYTIKPGLSAEHRDRVYKTLLSAFLSGRKVQVNVSGDTCIQGQPTFIDVALDRDQ